MRASVVALGTPEYQQELNSLNLTLDSLNEIGQRIFAGYSQATPHDAINAAGTYAYLAAVRGSRDVLCPLGWHAHRDQNLEMIFEPSNSYAIIPSSGDKNTGLNGPFVPDPQTKNQKGSQTDRKVIQNAHPCPLFPDLQPSPLIYIPKNNPTWLLLYHLDKEKSELRMELSLPINVHIFTLKVDQWKKRLILPPVTRDNVPRDPKKYQETISDFEVKRKVNE